VRTPLVDSNSSPSREWGLRLLPSPLPSGPTSMQGMLHLMPLGNCFIREMRAHTHGSPANAVASG